MNANRMLAISIITSLILMGLAMPDGEGQGENRESKNVHMNLKEGNKLSPETVHDVNESAQTRHVRAETRQAGNIIYETYWVDVGTWTSDGLKGDLTAEGRVVFNIWYQMTEHVNNNRVDWEFRLRYNDEDVAYVKAENTGESHDHPMEATAETTLNRTNIHASSGDTFSIYIRYKSAADCDVYFDHINYDSGASFSMDSVLILEADSKVSARFYDAWGLNWNREGKHFCAVDIEGNITQGDDETEISDGGEIEGENETTYQTTKIT
ncbi:MAG: hypothetical protein KAU14_05195, partial [Thermoplasmata archaeon]|nr:hypothetical protein [Thermoplasmata archaeon]